MLQGRIDHVQNFTWGTVVSILAPRVRVRVMVELLPCVGTTHSCKYSRQSRSVSYHTVMAHDHQLCLQTLPAVFTNTGNSDLLWFIPPTGLTKFK